MAGSFLMSLAPYFFAYMILRCAIKLRKSGLSSHVNFIGMRSDLLGTHEHNFNAMLFFKVKNGIILKGGDKVED